MAKKKREILKHPKNSIFELGYGQIPKKVMMDKRLSVEAKAIYAYFCSYCGGGNTAFPNRDKILEDLGISKDRFYKHLKLLTDLKFITIDKYKDYDNKFENNIYTINYNVK